MAEAKEMIKKLVEEGNKVDAAKAALKGFAGKVVGFELEGEDPKTMGIKVADDGSGTFVEGDIGATVFTIVADGEYWVKVMKGEEDVMKGFMSKKYSIKGNMMQATKLQSLFKIIKL
ncbi:MAG: SCP-2 sterol transfer family protein [Candidatus Methanolliviera sp. GoM_oil]|nr:MAG: SCP-2 sterol transfer family protein [Candidatus Methanolliviera sp. GoM_oil]